MDRSTTRFNRLVMETRKWTDTTGQIASNTNDNVQKVANRIRRPSLSLVDNEYNSIAPKNLHQDENSNTSSFKNNTKINAVSTTPVQEFYSGQSVFITGGTGFLGKMLIQKLLRTCPDISTIYLLIRPKGNQSVDSRLDNMFQIPIFNRLREEVPDFRSKIVPIEAKLSVDDLGLSCNEENLLIQDVSIIFHMVADVNFRQMIKKATMINVNVTRNLLAIAKSMKKLKAFIYVSTVYTNCHMQHNDERFYTYPIDHKTFLSMTDNLPEDVLSKTISYAFAQWPNTYTYTKAIAESLLKDASEDMPIGIYRPAAVISTAHDPIAGWIDNYFGPNGVMIFVYKGLLRFIICDANSTANVVPVDIIVNALIATAWDVSNQPQRRGDKTLIYNHVLTNDVRLTWGEFFHYGQLSIQKYPLRDCYWMPTLTLLKGKLIYTIHIWLIHLLPALLFDAVQTFRGARERLWTSYKKIHKLTDVIRYFAIRDWTYTDDNIQAMWHRLSKEDQHLLNFNMKGFDWPRYMDNYIKGMRVYLFKDDISSLEASRIQWKRLYWLHQAVKIIFMLIFLWLTWKLITKILA